MLAISRRFLYQLTKKRGELISDVCTRHRRDRPWIALLSIPLVSRVRARRTKALCGRRRRSSGRNVSPSLIARTFADPFASVSRRAIAKTYGATCPGSHGREEVAGQRGGKNRGASDSGGIDVIDIQLSVEGGLRLGYTREHRAPCSRV